jgi:hypothetical protein
MLKPALGLILCLLLSGCWELDIGPRPGLWYKHKVTGQEIKIEGTGWGKDVYKACSTLVYTTGTFKRQIMGYEATKILYNPAYDHRLCVLYEIEGDFEKKQPTFLCIIPAREIWTDYQRTTRKD